MRTLCRRIEVPWLGTAVVALAALFAVFSAGLWEASAFLPALVVAATIDHGRHSRE